MASTSPILPTLVLVLVVSGVTTLSPCHVTCSHFGTTPDNLADDPMDCHKYYRCFSTTSWSTYSFDCGAGENFDTVSKTCLTEGYICSPSCQRCTFSCDQAIMGQAAESSDCSSYYQCSDPTDPHECPADRPFFDGYLCQTDIRECCSCKPECSEDDALNHRSVPDYLNCTNYYLCMAPGVPDASSHGHCPFGNFDGTLGECVENGACETPCLEDPHPDSCVTNLTCTESGYFPRCTEKCDPYYFHCTTADIGHVIKPNRCTYDNVVDPFTVICIPPENCPVRQKQLTRRH